MYNDFQRDWMYRLLALIIAASGIYLGYVFNMDGISYLLGVGIVSKIIPAMLSAIEFFYSKLGRNTTPLMILSALMAYAFGIGFNWIGLYSKMPPYPTDDIGLLFKVIWWTGLVFLFGLGVLLDVIPEISLRYAIYGPRETEDVLTHLLGDRLPEWLGGKRGYRPARPQGQPNQGNQGRHQNQGGGRGTQQSQGIQTPRPVQQAERPVLRTPSQLFEEQKLREKMLAARARNEDERPPSYYSNLARDTGEDIDE